MTERSEFSTAQKIVFTLVIFAVTPVVLYGILELSGRLVVWALYGQPGKSYGLYVGDAAIGHMPAPNTYNHVTSLNDHAFRNVEDVIADRPPGALRVIVYGGSTVFSYNLPTEQTWPYKLERLMRQRLGNPAHQVLNAGVVLWSLSHAYERARREIPALKPDYVVLYSGINEEANAVQLERAGGDVRALVEQGKFGFAAKNYIASSWLHRNSIVFKVTRKLAAPLLGRLFASGGIDSLPHRRRLIEAGPGGDIHKNVVPDPYILKNYETVLGRFFRLARENGAKPVFIIQASGNPPPQDRRLVAYSAQGAAVARSMGVLTLDARDMVRAYPGKPMDLFYHTGIHYSARGADLFAAFVFDGVFGPRS